MRRSRSSRFDPAASAALTPATATPHASLNSRRKTLLSHLLRQRVTHRAHRANHRVFETGVLIRAARHRRLVHVDADANEGGLVGQVDRGGDARSFSLEHASDVRRASAAVHSADVEHDHLFEVSDGRRAGVLLEGSGGGGLDAGGVGVAAAAAAVALPADDASASTAAVGDVRGGGDAAHRGGAESDAAAVGLIQAGGFAAALALLGGVGSTRVAELLAEGVALGAPVDRARGAR